jgi:ADP-ribosylglycohydrolase
MTLDGAQHRARGSLLGQLCGDALGAPLADPTPEPPREMRGDEARGLLPGQGTEASELTLALARTLASEGSYEGERVAAAYVAWHRSGPRAPRASLELAFGGFPGTPSLVDGLGARADKETRCSAGLLRSGPLALLGWRLPPDELGQWVARDARLSHPHPLCRHAAVLFTFAIATALREPELDGPGVYAATLGFARERRWVPEILEDLEGAPEELTRGEDDPDVRSVFRNAFHHLARATSLEDALLASVAGGGDPSARACATGALVGAVQGWEVVPREWARAVLQCDPKRGLTYLSGDALRLADALVAAGDRIA